MSLANDFRPTTFVEVYGQDRVIRVLSRFIATVREGKLAQLPGIFLCGPSGVGKTTIARILAAELNDGDLTDYVELDGAVSGSVDAVRDIASHSATGHRTRIRVITLDECHALSAQAFSALLKQLEEPYSGTLYVLSTTLPEQVPETVRSRCLVLRLDPLRSDAIAQRLGDIASEREIVHSDASLNSIASFSEGNMRTAIMMLESAAGLGQLTEQMVADLYADPTHGFAERFLHTAEQGDAPAGLRAVRDAFNVVRDANVLSSRIIQSLHNAAITIDSNDGKTKTAKLIRAFWEMKPFSGADSRDNVLLIEGYWFACSEILCTSRLRQVKPVEKHVRQDDIDDEAAYLEQLNNA